jgi:hypothetical protein
MVTEFRLQRKFLVESNYRMWAGAALISDLADLLEIFVYRLKASTPPVYCFSITTIQSFLLISKAHMLKDG